MLTAAVESAADEVALRYNPTGAPADQCELTYRQLDERSSQVARELIERGIGPGDVVAIGIARSPESVLAVWAVAKTGAAHVVIDPTDPADRIAYIAADSGTAFGLTTSKYRWRLGRALYWIELDDPVQADRIARRPRHPLSYADRIRALDERHPAYITYTCGSTGEPVGIVVPHAGLGAVVAAVGDSYGISSDSRVVHSCPPTVDIAVLELLLACTAGATLVIAPAGVSGGRELGDLIRREGATHLVATAAVAGSVDPAGFGELDFIAVVGDRRGVAQAERWAGECRVVSSYGCSEAGIVATNTRPAVPRGPRTLGTVANGAGMLVLDARLRPVSPGETGELYLAGPVLAQGYANRPALTAARFVAVPDGNGRPGARMYRTGDLARHIETPYGPEIEFLDPADSQVRPHEPDSREMDDALARHTAVPGESELPSGGPDIGLDGTNEVPSTPLLERYLAGGVFPGFAQTVVLSLPAGIDRAGLAATVGAVLARHDMLRARVVAEDDRYRFEVPDHPPGAGVLISEVEVCAGSGGAGPAGIVRAAINSTVAQLDPLGGRMVAATWLRRPDARDALLLAVHRYVVDAASWHIVVGDLARAWARIASGRDIELPPVGLPFRNCAQTLITADRERERPYWRGVLATPDPLLGSRPVDSATDIQAAVCRFAVEVPAEIAGKVRTDLPDRYGTGADDPLVAALALAVRNWRLRRGVDCAVTRMRLIGDARSSSVLRDADTARTVGRFSTEYPVALDLSGIAVDAALRGGAETAALVQAVSEQLGAVADAGIGYGLLHPTTPGRPGAAPAQIGFVCRAGGMAERADPAWSPTDELGDFTADPDPGMPVDLVVDIDAVVRADGAMTVVFGYLADILDESAARELAGDWLAVLRALARHAGDPAANGFDSPSVQAADAELAAWRAVHPRLVEVLPLGPQGTGLFFRSQLTADGSDADAMLFALELGGVIDLDRLHSAAQALVDRYPALRSVFTTGADGIPVQLVVETAEVGWRVVEDVGDYEMAELLATEQRTGFAVDSAPPLRFTVYRTVSGRTHCVLVAHPLLFDSGSAAILLRDLLTLYARHGDGAALPGPPAYREYLRWRAHGDAAAAGVRWSQVLHGARPTELAAVLAVPAEPDSGYGESVHTLGEAETDAMAAYAVACGVTVETVVRALWALVLTSLTGRTDIVFGAVVPGRPPELSGADQMAGLLADTIPVRVQLEPGRPVRELLTRIESEQATLLEHHYLAPAGIAPGTADLFDTVLAFDPDPVDAAGLCAAAGALDGLEIVDLTTRIGSHHPVMLVVESADRLLLRLCYRRDRVAEPVAQALSGVLRALVGQLLAVPAEAATPAAGWWRPPATLVAHGELPADRPRPATPSRRSAMLRRELDGGLHDALNSAAEQYDTNDFTVVQAALAVLLARLSGQRETAVGAFVTKGSAAGLSVLHTDVNPASGFDALLAEAREAGAAALGTAVRGSERLGHLIDTLRTVGGRPPFRVLLSPHNEPAELPGKLDLRVDLVADGAGATLTFTYARDLFDAPTVEDHADRLLRILTAVAADPGVVVGDIDLLFPGERELVLREWNSAGAAVPPVTLVDLIEARGRLNQSAPAVRCGESVLSFGELLGRAHRVARGLIDAGAGPETLVAVAVPRTEELPVALLGVLLAGAAYLPIDTVRPWPQLVPAATPPVAVLTTAATQSAVPADLPIVTLEETAHHAPDPITDADRRAPLRPGNLMCTAPTSGPTGSAGVTHRNVVELFANTQLLFDFDDADVWALFHPLTSGFSIWELWCALAGGGCVVVVDAETADSPQRFRELLVRERVTVIGQTPSAFYRFAEADRDAYAAGDSAPSALRYVVLGGEALDLRRLRAWYERHGASAGGEGNAPWVVNMYGTTETTVHASFLPLDQHLVDNSASVIGRALPGLDAFVLDDRLQPVPVGVPGEIYVAGAQLARGYLDRPGLTASRFVADPFGAPGSRMYRSGDFGRWAGFAGRANLEYTGRRPTRPSRTEPEAVDTVRPEPAGDRAPYTEPAGRTETVVAAVFADLLGDDRIGADDDFFALGGNSLLASRAVARINEILGADLGLRTMFEAPVVAALAARVVPGAGRAAQRPALDRAEWPERIPLAPSQYRIWLRDRSDPAAHNIVLAVELTGALDTSALRHALSDVLERHEPLRTRYPAGPDGLPYQEILPVAQVLRGGLEIEDTDDITGRIAELQATAFDITAAAPIRGLLLATDSDEHVLALVAHRIAADGASPAPMMRDLMTAYLARVSGESPRWSPLPVQYADYAIWQRTLLGDESDETSVAAQQLDYWRQQLRVSVGGRLPADRPRPERISLPDAATDFVLPPQVHRSLDELADNRGATVFLVVHAAVTMLLHRLTGAGDIAVGRRLTGRDEPALADLVGRFANTVTVRTRVRATQTFIELLDRTRETNLAAAANADIPFDHVVDAVSPGQEPLFGVLLSPFAEPAAVNLPGLAVRGTDHGISDAEADLRIALAARHDSGGAPGELRLGMAYRTDLFDEQTVLSFGDQLVRILTTVAAEPRTRVGEFDLTGDSEHAPLEPVETAHVALGTESNTPAGMPVGTPGSGTADPSVPSTSASIDTDDAADTGSVLPAADGSVPMEPSGFVGDGVELREPSGLVADGVELMEPSGFVADGVELMEPSGFVADRADLRGPTGLVADRVELMGPTGVVADGVGVRATGFAADGIDPIGKAGSAAERVVDSGSAGAASDVGAAGTGVAVAAVGSKRAVDTATAVGSARETDPPRTAAAAGTDIAAGMGDVVHTPGRAGSMSAVGPAVSAGRGAPAWSPENVPTHGGFGPPDTTGAVFAAGPVVSVATAGVALARALAVSVEDDPAGPAVIRGDEIMTYQELDTRSSRLARLLIARGCGPGSGVVTALPRGMDAVVATWAVLAAGAALVPADAVAVAAAAGLTVEFGLAVATAPRQPEVVWLLLDDPAVQSEIGRQSPRPVTHVHRVRPLRGGDLVTVDAAGRQVTYDRMAAAVARLHTGTALSYEAATFGYGRGDGLAAVTEIVAAGAAGAAVALLPDHDRGPAPTAEWITHLWSDAEGLTVLDPGSLPGLTAVILAAEDRPGPAWAGVPCVLDLPDLFG
ncbi:condensation domain-containing protein [Nocardia flavorosea]|uniref:condensation domain-containing protein n=1 Tax=Nocardia flavorosea TaxID=53429 RepID=UPI001E2C165E|nr:condensation domain-containing protein [Nocardia flavorosea]